MVLQDLDYLQPMSKLWMAYCVAAAVPVATEGALPNRECIQGMRQADSR